MSSSSTLEKNLTVALVGAPNSGKTTLYNWLTNSKFKTVNYPGATVEYSIGSLGPQWGGTAGVVDTPGVYSLHPKSADEMVTLKVLYDNPLVGPVHGVIVVVDGTQLSRHLLMVQQIKETGFPIIIALTMSDLLRKQHIEVDTAFLEKHFKCPVVFVNGLLGSGIKEIVGLISKFSKEAKVIRPEAWSSELQEKKLEQIEKIAEGALRNDPKIEKKLTQVSATTRRIDKILLHPFLGLVAFMLIMTGLFSSLFWLAQPFMDAIDEGFTFLAENLVKVLGESQLSHFLGDGILAGFGAVLVFVPQIFILFVGIGLLEGSGYLARAATIIDKPFSKIGLSGRSFVPVLSGFACAVPAIIASRNIPSARDRWITNLIIPLMTCSARLPVYALLLAFIFKGSAAWQPGLALAFLYLASLVVGGVAAALVNRFLPKKEQSFFMMELPLYRQPRLNVILRQALTRTYSYVKRAGPVILLLSILIWVSSNFPLAESVSPQQKLEQSYLGQLGKKLEPVFEPMGADWRVGVGLISAFAAREVFVSSMAIVFNITENDEQTQTNSLLANMKTATNAQGRVLFTGASVVALIAFFMIALQCMSTVAISARESNSWSFAIGQLAAFNVIAYIIAVSLYQVLSLLPGWGLALGG